MDDALHGRRIGVYRIIRQLGAGGMGEVYEAEHVALGVRRALKVFSTESEHVEFLRKRFIDEGRILAAFQHPRIVRVYNLVVDEESEKAYFEMDLVLSPTGLPRTLADEQRDGISEDKIVGWFKDICEGLAYIHSQGVVHRDISLDNILIGPDGRAVITDFGIAKIIDDSFRKRIDMTVTVVSKDGSELRMGKGLYMAPELKKGGKATFASDAYAVGVILFRLLTGAWYAPGTNLDLLPNFKYDWTPVISRLCNVDPEMRLGEGGIAALPSLLKRVDVEMEGPSPLQADHAPQLEKNDSAGHEANNVPFWRWKWVALGGVLLAIGASLSGVVLYIGNRSVALHKKEVDNRSVDYTDHNIFGKKNYITVDGKQLAAESRSSIPSFDDAFFVPVNAPKEEPEDARGMPSQDQLQAALPDAWVLFNGVMKDLKAGRISRECAAERARTLARKADRDEIDMDEEFPDGYNQNGESTALAFLLRQAAEKICPKEKR